ncbi:DUF2971 domain-containing protein [Rhodococcoides fascians]|uniref:DUF2971 domain-containing protein n=1 Tax=Rhodococcoides fascians TaxID=1828 RepID=UPI0012D336FA|nr:DUF2971 domain-containing protein [Rhodococcus fascians]MDJ0411216.1 DUF2971 domain-containing protein [Rhodococcus fascians]
MVSNDSVNQSTDNDDSPASDVAQPIPEKLWHYTDAAGLMGILGGGNATTPPDTATFWATNLEYLNDHQELVFGLKHVRRAIEDLVKGLRKVNYAPHEPHIYVNIPAKVAFLERLLSAITGTIEHAYRYPIHCYVTSFSKEGDLLSQWRGYGAGLDGYAIAVDPKGLTVPSGHFLRPSARFAPVYYGDLAVPNELSTDVIERLDPLLRRTEAPPMSDQMIDQQLRWIATLAAQVKHEGFEEEAEWRYIDPGYNGNSYRTRGTRLIPYTNWNLDPDRVIGVNVGPAPSQHENVKAVRGLLNHNGFYAAADRVTFSKTPFRS